MNCKRKLRCSPPHRISHCFSPSAQIPQSAIAPPLSVQFQCFARLWSWRCHIHWQAEETASGTLGAWRKAANLTFLVRHWNANDFSASRRSWSSHFADIPDLGRAPTFCRRRNSIEEPFSSLFPLPFCSIYNNLATRALYLAHLLRCSWLPGNSIWNTFDGRNRWFQISYWYKSGAYLVINGWNMKLTSVLSRVLWRGETEVFRCSVVQLDRALKGRSAGWGCDLIEGL